MALAFLHRDAPRASLSSLPGLSVHRVLDPELMARLQQRSAEEMQLRLYAGHRPYVAFMNGLPAAWGWVAGSTASIGELMITFTLPNEARYLWNFVTLAPFRGQGIYPRLIEAIVQAESASAREFWIAYAPENHASAAGITKAGFTLVADLSFDQHGRPVVRQILPGGGEAASRLLGLPDTETAVTPCWRCVREGAATSSGCSSGRCSCDYQRPETSCA